MSKPIVPKGFIGMIVDKYHVGTPDSEIEADIRQRATKLPAIDAQKCVDYAIEHHHENGALYRLATGGLL